VRDWLAAARLPGTLALQAGASSECRPGQRKPV
jgi:hypothetical protein